MLDMLRTTAVVACLLSGSFLSASQQAEKYPSYDYQTVRAHEIKPHRHSVPFEGLDQSGPTQLELKLIVSATGDVIHAEATGDEHLLKIWPQLQGEVYQWKFTPFEEHGKAVTAEVEEYIHLVPPEQLPKIHVAPPVVRPDSRVTITLKRSGCYGTCPAYTVTVSTSAIVFEGRGNVVAAGKHTDTVDPNEVRKLAKRFAAANFYSMDAKYVTQVTDSPTYVLSITIDGHAKEVLDYMGIESGMPAVIDELEDEVDTFARTERWIEGSDGLVESLKAEKFDFATFEAQVMVKEAAIRGKTATVREFLAVGVPLDLPAPKPPGPNMAVPFDHVGWLTAASSHPETLQVLIDAGASKKDQADKELALMGAARSGDVGAVRALINYGADPNADLSDLTVTEGMAGGTMQRKGSGSVLISAAESGNPDVVREILRYHPDLERRDMDGTTAIFAAGGSRSTDKEGARVECVRLLAEAGANVNARDNDGNTPLHKIYLTNVVEELLRLGADVNARDKDGETPIFTNLDDDAIPLFIEHGADLTIRNNKGQTVIEAAEEKGPLRQEALRKAIQNMKQR